MANTTLLGFVLPTTGSLNGTWGTTINTQLTELLDSAIAGTTELTTDADTILTSSPLVANEARQPVILWNATGTATRTIQAPAQSKAYIVINSTGGTQSIVFKASGTTGVTIPAGKSCIVAWDGADFVPASNFLPSLKLGTALDVASGGTGAATLTGLVKGNGTGAMTAVAAPAGAVVGTTDIQTMENKRIVPRVNSVTSSDTITPTSDEVDQYNVTALAEPATFADPTGTPTDGQQLRIRIKDSGTGQPLTWASGSGGYRSCGATLPSTTVANKTTYVSLVYNDSAAVWDCILSVTQP
jgi:phage-related protein